MLLFDILYVNDREVSECVELIDKLKKEKKANPDDLDNFKQILIEKRQLHETTVDYLKSLDDPTRPLVGNVVAHTTKQNLETQSLESMPASQLRKLTELLHDEYKEQWDKGGVVQLKTDRMAILQRIWGRFSFVLHVIN